jgi:hypothetical protein
MTGATYPISKGSGFHPAWAPDGRELFFMTGPNQYVSVSAARGRPSRSIPGRRCPAQSLASAAAPVPQISMVLNRFEELKARVQTK